MKVLVFLLFIAVAQFALSQPLNKTSSSDSREAFQPLTIVVTNIAPWGSADQLQPEGLHVDLLRDIAQQWGRGYSLKVMPYARAVREVQLGVADLSVLFDAPGSQVQGLALSPLPAVDIILLGQKDLTQSDISRNTAVKIGRLRSANYGDIKLNVQNEQWLTINTVAQGVSMLQRGRLQMLLTSVPAYKYALQQLALDRLPSMKATALGEVRGAVYLSKHSALSRGPQLQAFRALVDKVVQKHWDKLQSMSQLHSSNTMSRGLQLEPSAPGLAAN